MGTLAQDLLKEEVIDMAKRVGASGFNLLVIDTENKVRPSCVCCGREARL